MNGKKIRIFWRSWSKNNTSHRTERKFQLRGLQSDLLCSRELSRRFASQTAHHRLQRLLPIRTLPNSSLFLTHLPIPSFAWTSSRLKRLVEAGLLRASFKKSARESSRGKSIV